MIKSLSLLLFCAFANIFLAAQAFADDVQQTNTQEVSSDDLSLIRAGSQAFVDAFNAHDEKAIAALWTKDGEFVNDGGNLISGRDAIADAYAEMFAEELDSQIKIVIDSLRKVSDSVAIEEGRAIVDPPPPGRAGISTYTATHVKEDGKWLMASVRDTWVEAAVTKQSVADLDWLVGTWTAEEHGNRIDSAFRWVANDSFLERTFTTTYLDGTSTSGMQLIGWNPNSQSVQSWSFSPDGGHAIGIWSPTSTGWVSESTGVTGDGLPTRSVNRFTKLDDNAIAWQSTERTVGGVAIPDTDEVVIKRKKSPPASQ